MRRFHFSLESVLTVSQKALEDARIKLANITNIYNRQNEILNEMIYSLNALQSESERFLSQGNFDANLIANYASYSNKMIQDIKMQENIIAKTKIDLLKQQNLVKEAYIKVKSLENLKDKQKEKYNKEMLLNEIKEIDDIVNSRRISA